MEPSHAERGRTLVYLGRSGTLSTHSVKHPGWPFGSVMPYAVDGEGNPIFLMSGMAVHSRNIAADPRASLLVSQPELEEDPLAGPRITLLGTVQAMPPADQAAAREGYLARHAFAAAWVDFQDFGFFRLRLRAIYFVGGFGAMAWISLADYAAAEPDPLADVAVDLVYQANLHYAPSIAHVASTLAGEHAAGARIAAVDRLGFQIACKTGDHTRELRASFPREVRTRDEAWDALLQFIRTNAHR